MSDYNDTLQEYFKLKAKYDKQLNTKKHTILADDEKSIKEKRKLIQNIKMKCIGCSKNVGTIFSDKDRTYSAVCGNRDSPCKLDISIKKGTVLHVQDGFEEFVEGEKVIKNEIIATKLNLLFGLISDEEMEQTFEELKVQHADIADQVTKMTLIATQEHEERDEKVKEKTHELYDLLEEQKELLDAYMKDTEPEQLREAIELYVTSILPTIKDINTAKYEYREMEKCSTQLDDPSREKCLVQKKNVTEHFEITTVEPEVIAFTLR